VGTIIGISYSILDEAKRNLFQAKNASGEEKSSLNLAKITLEVTGSSKLKISADILTELVKSVEARLISIERVTTSIDYAVAKFQEVDSTCANRIKNIGFDFRRSSGLLSNSEKFCVDPLGSIISGGQKAWKESGASDFWDKHGELITNVTICALEATAFVIALPAIAAMTAAGATVGVIALGVAAAIGAIYSVNTFADSVIKVVQKLQGKTGDEYTGFNTIQLGIQFFTHDKKKAEDIYNVTAIVAGVLTLSAGGIAGGLSKVKNIKALSEARSLEKTEPLVKDANKVAKLASKYDKLSTQNNARIIDHVNKVTGAGSKETRAFRQAKKSYDASIKYNDIQKEIIVNNKIVTDSIESTLIGGTAAGIEEIKPKGIESLNNLLKGTSKSTAFNPYLSPICELGN